MTQFSLAYFWILYVWNHTVCILLFLNIKFVRFLRTAECNCSWVISQLYNIPGYECIIVYLSIVFISFIYIFLLMDIWIISRFNAVIPVYISWSTFFPWMCVYLGIELLGCRGCKCLTLLDNSKLFFQMVVPIYTPTSCEWSFCCSVSLPTFVWETIYP